jgi:SAM-dependent methyltransferase
MTCLECATVYLAPPPGRAHARSAPATQRTPTDRRLRRWAGTPRPGSRFVRVDTPDALPRDGSFELVVLDRVLERTPDPARFLLEAVRLLSDDGHLIVISDNAGSSCFAVFGGRHWSGYAASGVRQQFGAESLVRLCMASGLRTSRVSTRFSADAWLDSAGSWLRDWRVGRSLRAVLIGRWFMPLLVAGFLESLALLRGRGALLVTDLVRK